MTLNSQHGTKLKPKSQRNIPKHEKRKHKHKNLVLPNELVENADI